ncbi:hypothetical protein ABZ799_01205 [Nocardiopsis dassonvillei]|uniref:hypothetical protein n=1 Tax=Nocardiopsis dassonvillei TaxID=2014 RepID=UPI0033D77104
MGREIHNLNASAALSNHNSAEDDKDARLWNEFVEEVRKLAAEPRFADLGWGIDVSADEAFVYGWPEDPDDD